jgi:hypothetical protein
VGTPFSRAHVTPPQSGALLTTTATSASTRPSSIAACSARMLDPPPLTKTATLAGPASRVAAARGAGARRRFDAPARLDARRGRDHARAAEAHDIAGEGGAEARRPVRWRTPVACRDEDARS